MAKADPVTKFPWDVPQGAWPAWYSVHRDARAELLCTAREDPTQFVEIRDNRDSLIPALRELARLRLIEFFELDRWDMPREQMASDNDGTSERAHGHPGAVGS